MNSRHIVCAYDVYKEVQERYPRRPIERSAYCPSGTFYWFGKGGAVRFCIKGSPGVWGLDYGRGCPFMKVRRIMGKR